MTNKEFVLKILNSARDDNLYRAQITFRNFSFEQMNTRYRESDKTPNQIIEEYKLYDKYIDNALAWINSIV